jgi:hypothetical protein
MVMPDGRRRVRVMAGHPQEGTPPVSTLGQVSGVTFVRKDAATMANEATRGIYIRNGKRYRYTAGDPIPADATVEGAETPADNQPKWYQAYREKAGESAVDRQDGETESAFKARLTDSHGPSESTNGQSGPSETT